MSSAQVIRSVVVLCLFLATAIALTSEGGCQAIGQLREFGLGETRIWMGD